MYMIMGLFVSFVLLANIVGALYALYKEDKKDLERKYHYVPAVDENGRFIGIRKEYDAE